jgi:hypothetical protein
MRKPGEPIYLGRHLLALALAVAAPIALSRVYELAVGPLTFASRMVVGVLIAVAAGVVLYRLYGDSARNEP